MTTQPHQSIVFIDSQVADYQTLINELPAGIEVHILDSASDGLMQIAAHLQQRSGLNSLHLISHGEPGAILLGQTTLCQDTLPRYRCPAGIERSDGR